MARVPNGSTGRFHNNAAVIPGGPPATIAAWVYPGDATTADTVFSMGDAGATNVMRVYLRGDTGGDPVQGWYRNNAATVAAANTSSGYSTGVWQHMCSSIDASSPYNLAVYLDGGSKGTSTLTSGWGTATETNIAATWNGAAFVEILNGGLADIAVWNAVLTDAEVVILARGYSPLLVRPQSLVSYWPFITQSGDELDYVGGFLMSEVAAPNGFPHPRLIYPGPSVYNPAASPAVAGGSFAPLAGQLRRRQFQPLIVR